MIAPNDSRSHGLRRRIDTLPQLARAVSHVDDADIPRCVLLLAVVCADATGIGTERPVAEAFSQWRSTAQVAASTRMALAEIAEPAEAVAADLRLDVDARAIAFRQARAVGCLYFASAVASDAPLPLWRDALRESCYEALHAMGGPAGVLLVLSDFVADPVGRD